mgnify:CR=1 FL=1
MPSLVKKRRKKMRKKVTALASYGEVTFAQAREPEDVRRVEILGRYPIWARADSRPMTWLADAKRGGGILGALGSHHTDCLRTLLGEPTSVLASVRTDQPKRGTDTATVFIAVTPVNDAPVATNDSYTVAEDGALNIAASGVLANDSDIDLDPLTAVLVCGPTNGSLAGFRCSGVSMVRVSADRWALATRSSWWWNSGACPRAWGRAPARHSSTVRWPASAN